MSDLIEREGKFKAEVLSYTIYPVPMLEEFFEYWSEANKTGKKMRCEMEKTWDLSKRLKRWNTNYINWNHGSSINSNGIKKPGTSEARVQALRNWGK